MTGLYGPLSPEAWIEGVFSSKSAMRGQVIRRARRDVDRYAGLERLLSEVGRRGYRAIENGGQVIIFCNNEPVRVLV
ncbi:hypothetical protein SAMN05421853_103397 [Roseivivax halotolerans]|jgi:hypothetical protein|uniref:N-(5'-phosphoribosyl)anthranilate isomerase n=1 Tax=Roseivivax halotolerans TaxID=93684 RepID=A0A1I5XHP4_9RHOB|nr:MULTISPECIES: N-(5'-phosphoribosyl)anthranilate isomerase [Roseivivax]QFT63693.1 hypothetical protein FIU91_12210 [Roseivivax sp. THAF30]SFQ31177.1 hypothetical protein SAMN05421853_103397 [Roseivivax halotolerans]